ncbi:MAG: hypothetical protein JWR21_1794 [Herminiimonas sp.]|nr:hypothetical protein [Herminiimonas sp.]
MLSILDLGNGINTVASGPDNGFYDCAVGALGAPGRHQHNVGAVSNIIVEAQPWLRAGIWGHGSPGVLLTYAQSMGTADQYFAVGNQSVWRRQVAGLGGKVNMLSLIGCKTGAGMAGASLLQIFANTIGMPVSAPTADVICGSYTDGSHKVWIDPSGSWQTFYPGRSMAPIDAPSYIVFQSSSEIMAQRDMHFLLGKGVKSSDIVRIDIDYRSPGSLSPVLRSLSSMPEIMEFLQFADLQNVVGIGGVFAEIITGSVAIEYRSGGSTDKLELDIYGDDKLVIRGSATQYFRLDRLFDAYVSGEI